MGVSDIAEIIEIKDLPGDLSSVAELIGLEKTLEIWMLFAGNEVRFPKKLPRAIQAKYICEYFDGTNKVKICRRLDICGKTFTNMLKMKVPMNKSQTDLFNPPSNMKE